MNNNREIQCESSFCFRSGSYTFLPTHTNWIMTQKAKQRINQFTVQWPHFWHNAIKANWDWSWYTKVLWILYMKVVSLKREKLALLLLVSPAVCWETWPHSLQSGPILRPIRNQPLVQRSTWLIPTIMSLLYLYPANLLSGSNLFHFLANLSLDWKAGARS